MPKISEHLTRGVVAATLTPLDDTGEPCMDLLAEHFLRLLGAGCSSVVLLGTTGEANSFTIRERMAILDRLLAAGISASTMIVGTGCCAVGDSVTLTKHALSAGCSRVLVLPPFYYKGMDDDGIVEAYSRTIDRVSDARLRLYLYQIPQFSGVDINSSIVETLLGKYPGLIAGIKDSSGNWDASDKLCARFGDEIDVLVGNERYLLAGLEAGATGCVTATANAFADLICEVFETRNASVQERASAARALFENYPLIPALKEFVAHRTGDPRWRNVRPPLTPLDDRQAADFYDDVGALAAP